MPSTMILRFRDLSSPVGDTVRLHREMIKKFGYAWWGWWAKQEESIPRDVFAKFTDLIDKSESKSLLVYLVDSGQNLLYKGTIAKIVTSPGSNPIDSPEPDKTPGYYISKTCKAWFKLTSIEPCELFELSELSYDEVSGFIDDPSSEAFHNKRIFSMKEMLSRLHRTIYFVQPLDPVRHRHYEVFAVAPREPTIFSFEPRFRSSNYIIHFSDLHFGNPEYPQTDSALQKGLTSLLGEDLIALGKGRPAAVIISGDLTWKGTKTEFQEALTFITMLRSLYDLDPFFDLIIVPGNHDITWGQQDTDYDPHSAVRYSSTEAERNYREFFTRTVGVPPNKYLSMGRRYLLQNFVTIDLMGLNSSRIENQKLSGYGYVGLDQLSNAASSMGWSKGAKPVTYRLAVLHHHLLPVTPIEDPLLDHNISITLDAGQLMYKMVELGIDGVSHGHQHQPFLASVVRPPRKDSIYQSSTPILIHGTGSVGVKRAKLGPIGKNAYSIYEFDSGGMTLTVRAYGDDIKGFQEWCRARIVRRTSYGLVVSNDP